VKASKAIKNHFHPIRRCLLNSRLRSVWLEDLTGGFDNVAQLPSGIRGFGARMIISSAAEYQPRSFDLQDESRSFCLGLQRSLLRPIYRRAVLILAKCKTDESEHHQDGAGYHQPMWILYLGEHVQLRCLTSSPSADRRGPRGIRTAREELGQRRKNTLGVGAAG
jgi:hypothetical protein